MNRIFTRIFLSYLAIGLSSALIITVIYYFIMREALIDRTYDQLSSINILKKEQIDNHFTQARKDLELSFTHDFFLEHFYPTGVGAGANKSLTQGGLPPEVKKEIQSIQDLLGFSSIGVYDEDLKEIFSTTSQPKFGHTVERIASDSAKQGFYIVDASDTTDLKRTVLLYIIPIHKAPDQRAFIVVEEDFRKMQTILNENTGMGNTGESYLVGSDRRLRSMSRFLSDKTPLEISVNPVAAYDTLHIIRDYRDIEVVSVRRSLGSGMPEWSIYSEIDLEEAMKPVVKLRNSLIVISILLLIVTIAVTAVVSNAISKPIMYLREIIIKLSKGVIPGLQAKVANRDEVGQIAEAVNQLISGLERTTKFAYAIGEGKFDTRFEKLSPDDSLGDALIHMRDQIKDLNQKEVQLVREKTAALLEGQENERRRITRELHDGVGQLLTVIRLRLEGISGQDALVREIKSLITETAEELKRISFNVMPSSLVDFGLEAALSGLCKQVQRFGKVRIDYHYVRESEHVLAFDITVAVYRIAQEGLNNMLKHSGATEVSLHVVDRDDEVFMLLQDDGKGFSLTEPRLSGFGLRSMEERAKLLHGTVDVHTEPGKGTAIEVHIPTR